MSDLESQISTDSAENSCPSTPLKKTPVSLLRDFCSEREISPSYVLIPNSGDPHLPVFGFSVSVGEFTASGSGQSKQKAKHDAAFNLLQIIEDNEKIKRSHESEEEKDGRDINSDEAPTTDPTKLTSMVKPIETSGIAENTVGMLQELCVSQKWHLPIYDIISEEGPPHSRVFTVACTIPPQPFKETGCAKNKKLAKKYSAMRMLQNFSDLLQGMGQPSLIDEEDGSELPFKTPVAILQEICIQQSFSLNYELVSVEGQTHEPTYVFKVKAGKFTGDGTGSSKKEAKQISAEAVLQAMDNEGIKLMNSEDVPYDENQQSSTPVITPTEPIGLIKEICIDHEFEKPTYEMVNEDGPPHQRVFTMVCNVISLNLQTKGSGESKKIAKKEAAQKMYSKLTKMGHLPLSFTSLKDEDGNVCPKGVRRSPSPKKTKVKNNIFAERDNDLLSPDNYDLTKEFHELTLRGHGSVDEEKESKDSGYFCNENVKENNCGASSLFPATNYSNGRDDPYGRSNDNDLYTPQDLGYNEDPYRTNNNDLYSNDHQYQDDLYSPSDKYQDNHDLYLPDADYSNPTSSYQPADYSNQYSDYTYQDGMTADNKKSAKGKKGIMGALKKKLTNTSY